MKKLLILITFFIVTTPFLQAQWNSIATNKVYDTTFYSATIPDSGVSWGSYTLPTGGTWEGINTGADTIFYKIQSTTPAVNVRGVPFPPMSSTGLMYFEAGTKIWFRERVNASYSELTFKGLEN